MNSSAVVIEYLAWLVRFCLRIREERTLGSWKISSSPGNAQEESGLDSPRLSSMWQPRSRKSSAYGPEGSPVAGWTFRKQYHHVCLLPPSHISVLTHLFQSTLTSFSLIILMITQGCSEGVIGFISNHLITRQAKWNVTKGYTMSFWVRKPRAPNFQLRLLSPRSHMGVYQASLVFLDRTSCWRHMHERDTIPALSLLWVHSLSTVHRWCGLGRLPVPMALLFEPCHLLAPQA